MESPVRVIIIMGVTGCGKSTVGKALAYTLNWPFVEGDDHHTRNNVNKMSQGVPLNDNDRQPWLEILSGIISDHLQKKKSLVMACSALKSSYRKTLSGGDPRVLYVHLSGNFDLIMNRIKVRGDHFMASDLLQSQYDTLEKPDDALDISSLKPVEEIISVILKNLADSSHN